MEVLMASINFYMGFYAIFIAWGAWFIAKPFLEPVRSG